MPAIRRNNIAAGTANALTGLKFRTVGLGGAVVTLFGSTAVAGGQITFSVEGGDRVVMNLAEPNVEVVADGVDTDRDLLLLNEPVGPGEMFLEVAAQVCNFAVFIEEGPIDVGV